MSGEGKHAKSKKRKVTDSCSICIGRGRIEESKSHSDQYCAHEGGPYAGNWKRAKAAKKTDEKQLKELLDKEQQEVDPLQIRDALEKVRQRRTVFDQAAPRGPAGLALRRLPQGAHSTEYGC